MSGSIALSKRRLAPSGALLSNDRHSVGIARLPHTGPDIGATWTAWLCTQDARVQHTKGSLAQSSVVALIKTDDNSALQISLVAGIPARLHIQAHLIDAYALNPAPCQ